MWSVRIYNFDGIIYGKTKLFYSYYCQIRVLFKRIFTEFILYILTQLGPIDKLNDYDRVDTKLEEGQILNSTPKIVTKDFSRESNENEYKEKIQFLMLASQIINCNYAGDPSSLMSFINSVELLERIANSQEEILRLFILSKLEGRALVAVSVNQNTIDEIKDSLKKNIRYDQSNLISAKIQALPYERLSLLQFIDQCKTLASDYQRSLIDEGFTKSLAIQETISKCLEACVTKTRSNIVKLILHAASFDNTQDLFSKFLSAEIRERTNSKYSLTFNSYNNYKRNQNYNNKFNNCQLENNELQYLGKRHYSNIYSLNENKFQYKNQHYRHYNTFSRNTNNNRNFNENYCFNRYDNYNSKKLFSDKTNDCDSTRYLFCDFDSKNSINPRINHENNINQTNEQRKQEPYFHESKNITTIIKATKTSPFHNEYSRYAPQYVDKTNYQINSNLKHNNSSITLKNGTNEVIKNSGVDNMSANNFTCSSSSYKLNDFSQRRKNNPYFKTKTSSNTMKQVPFCQGNIMKNNTDYKDSSSLRNSSIPSHDTKTSYDRSTLTNSERENTSNFNKSASQNYYRTPFHGNFDNHIAYSDAKIKFDNKSEMKKLKAQCISEAEIEDLGAEWP